MERYYTLNKRNLQLQFEIIIRFSHPASAYRTAFEQIGLFIINEEQRLVLPDVLSQYHGVVVKSNRVRFDNLHGLPVSKPISNVKARTQRKDSSAHYNPGVRNSLSQKIDAHVAQNGRQRANANGNPQDVSGVACASQDAGKQHVQAVKDHKHRNKLKQVYGHRFRMNKIFVCSPFVSNKEESRTENI